MMAPGAESLVKLSGTQAVMASGERGVDDGHFKICIRKTLACLGILE